VNKVAFSAIENHAKSGMQELVAGVGAFLITKGVERFTGKSLLTQTAEILSGIPAGTGAAKLLESGAGYVMATYLSMQASESIRRRLDTAFKNK
jgi:hypothetical protein